MDVNTRYCLDSALGGGLIPHMAEVGHTGGQVL
jgi:hypothetical protein